MLWCYRKLPPYLTQTEIVVFWQEALSLGRETGVLPLPGHTCEERGRELGLLGLVMWIDALADV